VTARRTVLLIAVIAAAAGGLGLWLGTTVAPDISTIAVIVAVCAILGSFAPTTIRWVASSRRRSRQ
jgi:hypothetical protein